MASPVVQRADIVSGLALALIKSSNAPLLLLGGDLAVIAASTSFCDAFRLDAANVTGRPLAQLGDGEWGVGTLSSLLRATASGRADIDAYEMDLTRDGEGARRLVLNARRLPAEGDAGEVRLVLSVVDVTDARNAAKRHDDLLREKAFLLQELQHRVANSLQIIASVLLQSARRVQSDESRTHLHDAHHRVMSVAALQRQLSLSRQDDVSLRSYLIALCQSLGASMIRDNAALALVVEVDDSIASADVSVSLGLIVTELVINAFKHAFPIERGGRIVVGYRSTPTSWTLSVHDDGIGVPSVADGLRAGLGTSIVRALATQLDARIEVAAAEPGTRVSIIHTEAAKLARPVAA